MNYSWCVRLHIVTQKKTDLQLEVFADAGACCSESGSDDGGSGGDRGGDGTCVCCTQQTYISKFRLKHFGKDIIFRMYDDTKLHATLTDDNNSPYSLQEKLQEWSMKMQMNFFPDKYHILHLRHSNPQNIYHMNNARGNIHMLDAVTSETDLGVTIEQQLKFSDHFGNAVKKANRVLGCLARTFRHLN